MGPAIWVLMGLVACVSTTSPVPTELPEHVTQTVTSTWTPLLPTTTPTFVPPRTTPTLSPTPTATPILHIISSGDTLLGIALRYQVEMADLYTANPGIDPAFLTVGETLVVPLEETLGPPPPVTTPLPVKLDAPVCYRTGLDGLWCLTLAHNLLDVPVENLEAQVILYNRLGEGLATGHATAALNLWMPGDVMPLFVLFEATPPEFAYATADLVVALPASDSEQRYLQLSVDVETIELAQDGLSARISGTLLNEDRDSRSAGGIRVLALAIEPSGKITGFRLWELLGILEAGQEAEFELILYRLGEEIDQVQIMVEARTVDLGSE